MITGHFQPTHDRKGGYFRRFYYNRVSCCQCRCCLPGHEQQGIIPGHNTPHNPIGFLHYHTHGSRSDRSDDPAALVTADLGIIFKNGSNPFDFIQTLYKWFTAFSRNYFCYFTVMDTALYRHLTEQIAHVQ